MNISNHYCTSINYTLKDLYTILIYEQMHDFKNDARADILHKEIYYRH